MKILGIDTSGKINSAALCENGMLLHEISLPPQAKPSQGLLAAIDELLILTGCHLSQLDGMALAVGPGSFTGLRVGVSTVKGLAWVHNKPVSGINTLDALAFRVSAPGIICPLLDAKQGEVYTALYRRIGEQIVKLSEYLLIAPQKLPEMIKEPVSFLGDGLAVYQQYLQKEFKQQADFKASAYYTPTAAVIAQMGYQRFKQGLGVSPYELTPYYLRRPAAEVNSESGS
ncbi:MAG: tRNA (adenosine(37)-N6)-threonylcarbamoyltransferase complex dimerization subunit type 1 TsaB [Candidatus Schekmanbacteria bacterium]|nr:tRNA (adenosine(37)-N6)-threonylcarbamoyltransferase complex dimerization subunit type 1 TsaB [Candidatus Schekmanbacteria bacterium]